MFWAAIVIFIVFFVYAFQWVFALVPYFLWLLFKFWVYPLEVISQVVYPVWPLVYSIYIAVAYFTLFKLVFGFYKWDTWSWWDWTPIFKH